MINDSLEDVDTIYEQLKRIAFFKGFPPHVLAQLNLVAKIVDYEANQIIMMEGDYDAPVFFIITGIVRVFRSNTNGREQTLIDSTSDLVFNLPTAFTTHHASPATAETVVPTQFLLISQSDFCQITLENPEVACLVLQNMANRIRYLVDLTYDLSLRSVRGRLARFLLVQSNKEVYSSTNWTQEEIATHINSVRGVVNRILREFIKEGIIKMDRHRIVILDTELLQAEAEI